MSNGLKKIVSRLSAGKTFEVPAELPDSFRDPLPVVMGLAQDNGAFDQGNIMLGQLDR
jgi:hypothetical protein